MAAHTASENANPVGPPPAQRLLSLDVLRGLTVALMILVNNAGDGRVSYAQLRHSAWNGCTLTDIVFPTFLFIVGASVALAFRNRLRRGASKLTIAAQVLRRSLLIFALGLFLNALPFFHLGELRIYGVLQRIALCYLCAGLLYLYGGAAACIMVAVLTIGGYWLLLTHVGVPGFGMPGIQVPLLDFVGNLPAWVDRRMLSPAHLYRHSTYDPEGLLSTLPALGTTLLGVLAGLWLQCARPAARRALVLAASGALLLAGGLLWGHFLPLNKRLWTSSYALYTAGIAATALAILFWFVDGPTQLRRGLLPWRAFGTNALAAYILSEVLAIVLGAVPMPGSGNLQRWLYGLLPERFGPPPLVSVLYSVLFVLLCLLPMLVLYRRRIFIKI